MKIRRRPEDEPNQGANADARQAAAPVQQTPDAVAQQEAQRPGTHGGVWRDTNITSTARRQADPRDATTALVESQDMPTTEDFASMFGGSDSRLQHYKVGDRVKARVVSFGRGVIFVSLGAKTEGSIESAEFVNPDGTSRVAPGDEIEAFVTSTQGGVHLSTVLSKSARSAELLVEAHAQGIPVEGKVVGTNKGGFDVTIGTVRAFCPVSQLDFDANNPERHLNQTYRFLITRADEGGRNFVVSRTQLIREERRRKAEETLGRITEGTEVEGVVSRLTEFGAFVDIGGLEGMVHVSELSWGRNVRPEDVIKVGDAVRAKVLRIEDGDKGGKRIALSTKALQSDPWLDAVGRFMIGQSYPGVVARLEKFGAFVELAPGVDGLVHISEMAQGKRVNQPSEVAAVGDSVRVQVLDIDPRKRQIALSMKALMDDPWAEATSQFPVGTKVQGTVDSVKDFGIFITLAGGVSGLLPLSHLAEGEEKGVAAKFPAGKAVEATVIAIEPERRRITLSRKATAEFESQKAFADFSRRPQPKAQLGTLADLFSQARKS